MQRCYSVTARLSSPQYNKQKINAFMVGYDHAAKQVNESLEAYNRECKRVDELTIERDHWLETAKSHGTKIRELEGLLKEIIRFKPSLLACIQKDFQYPDNAIKALEDAEKSLNL